jgi:hypothetical protein
MLRPSRRSSRNWIGLIRDPQRDVNGYELWTLTGNPDDLFGREREALVFPPGVDDEHLTEAIAGAMAVRLGADQLPDEVAPEYVQQYRWVSDNTRSYLHYADNGDRVQSVQYDPMTTHVVVNTVPELQYALTRITDWISPEGVRALKTVAILAARGTRFSAPSWWFDDSGLLEHGYLMECLEESPRTYRFMYDPAAAAARRKQRAKIVQRQQKARAKRTAVSTEFAQAASKAREFARCCAVFIDEIRDAVTRELDARGAIRPSWILDLGYVHPGACFRRGRSAEDGPADPVFRGVDRVHDGCLLLDALMRRGAHRRLPGWNSLRATFRALPDVVRNQPRWWCVADAARDWWRAELKVRRARSFPSPTPVRDDTDCLTGSALESDPVGTEADPCPTPGYASTSSTI